jgi:hypothetical protein
MKTKIYLGYVNGIAREIFRSKINPTRETHGEKYKCVVGPFRTIHGAKFMLNYGYNNPHCQCVADAERLAKKYR